MLSKSMLLPKIRLFSSSPVRTKKSNLQKIGAILQGGSVDPPSNDTTAKAKKADGKSALDACVERNIDQLENGFSTVVFMSSDDITIQDNFNKDRQFGGILSSHFLDRKEILRDLPDSIDILNTPWEEIKEVYESLLVLDQDRAVLAKYIKQYGIKQGDLITKFRMDRTFPELCKSGRREEKYKEPTPLERVFKKLYLYDVLGFDRSLVGVPQNGISNKSKLPFPTELVKDQSCFDTNVTVHKIDVNIMDDDAMKKSSSPHDAKPESAEEVLHKFGRPIFIDKIDNYEKMNHQLPVVVDQVQREIKLLQDMLYLEITRKLLPNAKEMSELNNSASSEFIIPSREQTNIKTNEHILVAKELDATVYTGPTIRYSLKTFDLIPLYGSLLQTVRHHNLLYKHLFKILLINCENHMDILTRIKYKLAKEVKGFHRKLFGRIHNVVTNKIMPVALANRRKVGDYDAILHKFCLTGNFLRIHWIRRPTVGARRDYDKCVRRFGQVLRTKRLNG